MARSRSSAKAIARVERHSGWIDLRLQGHGEAEIAQRYGVSQQAISEAILKYLHDRPAHGAEFLRRLENEHLDYLSAKLAPAIDRGDLRAIDTAVRISERRSKLLGLDAPKDIRVAAGSGAGIFGMLASSEPIDPETIKAIQALDPIIKPANAPDDAEIVRNADDGSLIDVPEPTTDAAAANRAEDVNENGAKRPVERAGKERNGNAGEVSHRKKLLFESL